MWRNLHRRTGLALAGFIGFYCITGLLLNHRQEFGYFQDKKRRVTAVPVSDPAPLRSFFDTYKSLIDRKDDPAVIRIRKGGEIEFLYGSHGKITYVIDPINGTMETVEKVSIQPWTWLNDLHKVFKTSGLWLVLADAAAVGVFFLVLSGLVVFRFKVLDVWLLFGGIVLWAAVAFLA